MEKLNRVYELKVETGGTAYTSPLMATTVKGVSTPIMPVNAHVTIAKPYAIHFTISRQNLAAAQTGTFEIRNLSPEVRQAIQKEIFDASQFRAIQLRAGYSNATGTFMPLIFNGGVLTAFSERRGQDWITTIEAFDGGFAMVNGNVSMTLQPGNTSQNIITMLAQQLPGTTGQPIVGNFPTVAKRGEVLFGNIWDIIRQKSNGRAFIDNGQVKVLNYNEAFVGGITLIDDSTGLIGSPRRTQTTVDVDMVFEPNLTVGQITTLRTSSQPQLNKQWAVIGFEHDVTITDSGPSGDAITSAHLWFTQQDYQIVSGTPVF